MEDQVGKRRALVTGASRGLGRVIALELARSGFEVAIHFAGNRAAAEETARQCRAAAVGRKLRFPLVQADLGNSEEREGLVGRVWEELGGLEAFVSNAGVAPKVRNDLLDLDEDDFDRLMAVNLKGPLRLAQAIGGRWVRDGGDCGSLVGGYKMVFVSSISAAAASLNRGGYCISKAGLAMVARLWALRLAGIGQVIELRPGIMATDMTAGVAEAYDSVIRAGEVVPAARWGTGEDVGKAAAAFCRGELPFITGDIIHIDGGFHVPRL